MHSLLRGRVWDVRRPFFRVERVPLFARPVVHGESACLPARGGRGRFMRNVRRGPLLLQRFRRFGLREQHTCVAQNSADPGQPCGVVQEAAMNQNAIETRL